MGVGVGVGWVGLGWAGMMGLVAGGQEKTKAGRGPRRGALRGVGVVARISHSGYNAVQVLLCVPYVPLSTMHAFTQPHPHTRAHTPPHIVPPKPTPGAFAAGKMTEEERFDTIRHACPGAGACGGMYTANTMASAIEALGMSLPYSSSIPAEDPLKIDECRMVGR